MERGIVVVCNHKSKFLHVAQNFLTDSLAGAVDADFDTGTCEKHGCAKHRDADCLAKPTRG